MGQSCYALKLILQRGALVCERVRHRAFYYLKGLGSFCTPGPNGRPLLLPPPAPMALTPRHGDGAKRAG
jgi:hypothetical protein